MPDITPVTTQVKKTMQILLADDDEDDRFFFDKALTELSLSTQLTTVNDGEELMNYLNTNSDLPNIIFLDLNMPCKNGFECLSEIKHNEKLKDIQVVMFSTSYPRDMNYERDMINLLFDIGASDYIRKPEDFVQLKQVIQNILVA